MLGDFFQSERGQAGGRSERGVAGAGLHRRIEFIGGERKNRGAGGLQYQVHLARAPAYRHTLGISAANRRQSRSRKSPSVAVPPGNWCEIFSAVPAWAIPNRSSAGAAIPRARACRLETFIPYLPRRIAFFMIDIVYN